ncbi:MAG: hypothetical protein QW303_08475 [Nitrososphaerota archaeon]
MWRPTEQEKLLLKQTASPNREIALAAQEKIAQALELPLRAGVQPGDIVGDIFEVIPSEGASSVEFPLHFMAPGTESDYVAFTVPRFGAIPQRVIMGDFVTVPIYDIAGSIDWDIKYARDARWDVVADAAENLRMQFVKKRNDDGWHTILSAGYNRGIVAADDEADAGFFSVRLVSLMKVALARNGGGNTSSINRSYLTDLYVSVEAEANMRSWGVDQVDEITRREIFTSPDGVLSRVFGVNIHALTELGVGAEYQLFYSSVLGGSLPNAGNQKVELVVGLDRSRKRSFVMPESEPLTIVPDETKIRSRQRGYVGWQSLGFGVLDSRTVLLGAF